MEYRQLGLSGLRVSAIGLGTMTFGGDGEFGLIGNVQAEEAKAMLDWCLDHGVNLVDTADMYSGGLSESILGEAMVGRRDEFVVATKVRFPTGQGVNDAGLSRRHIIRSCEASLRRLQTDYIDLYQAHMWDGVTPLDETLAAFDSLVRDGKVRYIGCSNHSSWHLMKALSVSRERGLTPYVSHQIHYTAIAREAEYELMPLAIHEGVGTLVWSPLAGGLLTGKYKRDGSGPEGSRHVTEWDEPPVVRREQAFDTIDVMRDIAARRNLTVAQIALAYIALKPGVTSLIVGARRLSQLDENAAAVGIDLDADEIRTIDDVSQMEMLYPYWHQAREATDRLSEADLSLLGRYIEASRAAS
jgi:aryl-alcohol dehydrogenase-like predicted oxidoreductase